MKIITYFVCLALLGLGIYDFIFVAEKLSVLNFILILAGSLPWIAAAFETLELTKDGIKTRRINELEKSQNQIADEVQNLKKNVPSFREINTPFECIEVHVTLRYLDEENMEYIRTKKVRALQNNLSGFVDKYHWTGDREVEIKCRDAQHIFVDKGRLNLWNFYEVRFQKAINKGDVEEFSVVWKLSDRDGNFQPFIAAVIEAPTEKLCLSLDASAIRDRINSATYEISSHLGSHIPYETGDLNSDTGVYTYMVDGPAFLHNYEMRWSLK